MELTILHLLLDHGFSLRQFIVIQMLLVQCHMHAQLHHHIQTEASRTAVLKTIINIYCVIHIPLNNVVALHLMINMFL